MQYNEIAKDEDLEQILKSEDMEIMETKNKNRKIIGFSGKKQGGKTTAINCIRNKRECVIIDFAECLKELVFRYFAAPTLFYKYYANEPFVTEESKQRKHPCGKTYREILQFVGTDICRNLWPEIWIENYKFRVSVWDEPLVLTTDVRFPNEVKCIQDLGGHVIRLLRAPFFETDKHESETALDWLDGEYYNPPKNEAQAAIYNLRFDAFIDNREMSVEEKDEAVWTLVNEKGWI